MKKSKYNAKKVQYGNLTFDSKLELTLWQYLERLQAEGKIEHLQRQVKFELLPKSALYRPITYIADFVYDIKISDTETAHIIADAKGMVLPEFKLKQKLFFAKYNIPIFVFKSKKDIDSLQINIKNKLF